MAQSSVHPRLNKQLYTEITRLKLLNKNDAPVKFLIDKSPFSGDEDSADVSDAAREEYIITGRIFPNSEIFNQGSYLIEMKLTLNYPLDPPDVRFLTPIYHPNVAEDGQFCHTLLKITAKWTPKTSLVEVIKAVVEHVDHPDIDYSLGLTLGKEYMENRAEFNRKALEWVTKHALPRS